LSFEYFGFLGLGMGLGTTPKPKPKTHQFLGDIVWLQLKLLLFYYYTTDCQLVALDIL